MESVSGTPRQQPKLEDIKAAKDVALCGIVHKIRDMGQIAFVMLRTSRYVIQCVADRNIIDNLDDIKEGYSVRVRGKVREESRANNGFEIYADAIEVLSRFAEPLPIVINKLKSNVSIDTALDYRPASLRDPQTRAVFRVQATLARAFAEYLTGLGFTEIHTPKIVCAGAEGGSNIFRMEYFERKAFLAQSPQFYKQAMVPVFERVFEIGPVFRAEKHNTTRHLNEYTSLDLEMGFIDSFYDIMNVECGFLKYAMKLVKTECAYEIGLLGAEIPEITEIPTIKFMDAKEAIAKKYNKKITSYRDIEPKEEELICRMIKEETGSEFVFVTHYPTSARPFYAMEDPEDPNYTLSFDLLFRGLEVTTGGQRIHDYYAQVEKMRRLNMDVDDFEGYLMTHKYGAPPHGGLGLGLERLTMQLLGLDNVRMATLFPRDQIRLTP